MARNHQPAPLSEQPISVWRLRPRHDGKGSAGLAKMAILAIEEIAQERGGGSTAVHHTGFAAERATLPWPEVADLDFDSGADFVRCEHGRQCRTHPGICKRIQHGTMDCTVRVEVILADLEGQAAPALGPLLDLESQEISKWMWRRCSGFGAHTERSRERECEHYD